MTYAQESKPSISAAPSQEPAAAMNDPKKALRGKSFDEQSRMLAPQEGAPSPAGDNEMFDAGKHLPAMAEDHRAPGSDNEMFDAGKHLPAMAEDHRAAAPPSTDVEEAAPPSVRDPAALNATRIDVLRRELQTEYDDNAFVARQLAPAVDAIDEKLKTVTGEEKAELEATRKDLSTKLGAADKKVAAAHKDLELLDKGPDVTPAALNDMLARRQVTVAQAGSRDTTTSTAVADDMSVDRKSTTIANAMLADGSSATTTDVKKTNIGLTGGSHTSSNETQTIQGDTTTTDASSTSHSVDLNKGTYTSSKTQGTSTDKAGDKQGTSTKSETTVGPSGVTRSKETTTTVGDDKSTVSSATGVTRGDGQFGGSHTRGSSTENEDGSGSSSSTTGSGGIIAGKDGVGVFGKGETSGTKKYANGLSVNGKAAAGGKCLYNIEPIPDTDPVMYQITGRIMVDGSLGVGASGEKESKDKSTKGSIGGSGSVSASVEMRFSKKLDEASATAWKAQMNQLGNGDRELMILTTGLTQIGANVTNELQDGESRGLTAEVKGEVSGDASGKAGGASVGGGIGYEKGRKVEGDVRRDGDTTTTDIKVTDSSALSGNVKGGYGVASMSVGGKSSESAGVGYKFKIPDDYPNAIALRAEAENLRTQADLDAFAKAHPKLVAGKTDIKGQGSDVTTGVAVGPLGAAMTSGGSTSAERSVEYDEKGGIKETNAKYTGESHLGGTLNAGPLAWGSNSTEQLEAKVKTTKDDKGKDVQVASADVSDTDKETSIDVDGTLDALGGAASKPLGLLTGSTKIIQEKEKQEVAGFFMDDDDFNAVMAKAKDPKGWNKAFSRVANMEDWERCRSEIEAAGGDKEKVAAALAKYSGGGDHDRKVNLEELLDVHSGGGGDRYEFPDGLGDLKGQYLALVVNNPMAKVDTLVAEQKLAEAAEQATALAGQVDSLAIKLEANRSEFHNANVFGEMVTRTTKRQSELKIKGMELAAKASGKDVKPETLERVKAAEEFNRTMGVCKEFVAQEQRLFEKINANHTGTMGNHSEAENVTHVNQLRANVKIWEPQYQQMVQLANLHGFDAGGAPFKSWKPDRVRLDMAYKGQNPMSDEAVAAQQDADSRDRMASEQNADIGKRSMEAMSATAGMTRRADGSYYREFTADEKKAAEAKQYDEIKPRVIADFKSREGAMAAAKAAATQAKGKCNLLTSAGNWDKVSKAAQRPYNEGFRLFASAERAWQAALAASNAKDFSGITKYFPNAQSAVREFTESAENFKKGDAL